PLASASTSRMVQSIGSIRGETGHWASLSIRGGEGPLQTPPTVATRIDLLPSTGRSANPKKITRATTLALSSTKKDRSLAHWLLFRSVELVRRTAALRRRLNNQPTNRTRSRIKGDQGTRATSTSATALPNSVSRVTDSWNVRTTSVRNEGLSGGT